MNTICLNMIVKDEAPIIRDTLANITQHFKIDYWVISDTGSSDNTVGEIERFFSELGIPGEIGHEPWRDFAYNRNCALQQCAGKADYVLFFDADDRFEGRPLLPERLEADQYALLFRNEADFCYSRPLLIKNDAGYRWRGVLHEFLHLDGREPVKGHLAGDYCVLSGRFGNRSTDPDKYRNDALRLQQAFESDGDEDLKPRYAFYCAQSYRDADDAANAAIWYQKRIEMGGWIEEIACAYENLGSCLRKLGQTPQALYWLLEGYNYHPQRAESVYLAACIYREEKKYRLAYEIGKLAESIAFPENDILFVRKSIYDFWAAYELSISSYYVGDFATGYRCCKKVLLAEGVPESVIHTTLNNLSFYKAEADKDVAADVGKLHRVISAHAAYRGNAAYDEVAAYFSQLLGS